MYSEIKEAHFRSRLNRFVILCEVDGEEKLAHLPNPGRMWELLFPDTLIYLVPVTGKARKTELKVIGIERDGVPVMLDTHYSNRVAEILIARQQIPQLVGWQVLKREVPFGHSRFDLLLGRGEERFILEIKSCTLFGKQVAMFRMPLRNEAKNIWRNWPAFPTRDTGRACYFLFSGNGLNTFCLTIIRIWNLAKPFSAYVIGFSLWL